MTTRRKVKGKSNEIGVGIGVENVIGTGSKSVIFIGKATRGKIVKVIGREIMTTTVLLVLTVIGQ